VTSGAKPAFADLDGNGDLDALVGVSTGILEFFQNTGSATSPAFLVPNPNSFGLSEVPDNPTVNFHGEKRSNATHASTTDPESTLARKSNGTTAKLSFAQHVLMENRYGLVVDLSITSTVGTSEAREAVTTRFHCPQGRVAEWQRGDEGLASRQT